MKVHVQGGGHNIHIGLPTGLIFNRYVLRFALRNIRLDGVAFHGLSRKQADALALEMRRIKKKHGSWTLVEVCSADGEQVTVTL